MYLIFLIPQYLYKLEFDFCLGLKDNIIEQAKYHTRSLFYLRRHNVTFIHCIALQCPNLITITNNVSLNSILSYWKNKYKNQKSNHTFSLQN